MQELKNKLNKLAELYLLNSQVTKKYEDFETPKIYNLIAKYVFLGGKIPQKYNITTNLFAKPNDKKFLNDKKLYRKLNSFPALLMNDLIDDIGAGRVKLKPIKYFNKQELDRLYKLVKEYYYLKTEATVTEKRYRYWRETITGAKDYSEQNKIIYKYIKQITSK